MPNITINDLGTLSNAAGPSVDLTLGTNVPAGSLVVVCIVEISNFAPGGGSVADSPGNGYQTNVAGGSGASLNGVQANGFGQVFWCGNCNAISSGQLIAYNKASSGAPACISAFYITEMRLSSSPTDLIVNATGSSTTPSVSGPTTNITYMPRYEVAVGFVASNAASGDTFTQDTGHGFATPPSRVSQSASAVATIEGGSKLSFQDGRTETYAPTLGTSRTWAAFLITFLSNRAFTRAAAQSNFVRSARAKYTTKTLSHARPNFVRSARAKYTTKTLQAARSLAALLRRTTSKRLIVRLIVGQTQTFQPNAFQNDTFQVTDNKVVQLFKTVTKDLLVRQSLFLDITSTISKDLLVLQSLFLDTINIISKDLLVLQSLFLDITSTIAKTLRAAVTLRVALISAFQGGFQTFQLALRTAIAVAASLTRNTTKDLFATVNLVVSLQRLVSYLRTLSASVSTLVRLTRTTTKSLIATVNPFVSLVERETFLKTLQVAVALSVSLQRSTAKLLTTAISVAASLQRTISKTLAAFVTIAVTLIRTTSKDLFAALSLFARLTPTKAILRALSAAIAVSVTLTRNTAKLLSAAHAVSVVTVLLKTTSKILVAAQSLFVRLAPAVTYLRQLTTAVTVFVNITVNKTAQITNVALSTAIALSVSLRRNTAKLLTAAISVAATLTRTVTKDLLAAVTLQVTLFRQTTKDLFATLSLLVRLASTKASLRSLSAAISVSATLIRSTAKLLAVAQSLFISVSKTVAKLLSASHVVSVTTTLLKTASKILVVAQSLFVRLNAIQTAQVIQKALSLAIAVVASVTRPASKVLSVAQGLFLDTTSNIAKRLSAVVSPFVALVRQLTRGKALTAAVNLFVRLTRAAQRPQVLTVALNQLVDITSRVAKPLTVPLTLFLDTTNNVRKRLSAAVALAASVVRNKGTVFQQALRAALSAALRIVTPPRGVTFMTLNPALSLRVRMRRKNVVKRLVAFVTTSAVSLANSVLVIFAGLPVWPAALGYLVIRSSYTITPIDEIARAEMDIGPARLRRRFNQVTHQVQFDVHMTGLEVQILKSFFEQTLNHGTMQFVMPLYNGNSYANTRVRFATPLGSNPQWTSADFAVRDARMTFSLVAYGLVM